MTTIRPLSDEFRKALEAGPLPLENTDPTTLEEALQALQTLRGNHETLRTAAYELASRVTSRAQDLHSGRLLLELKKRTAEIDAMRGELTTAKAELEKAFAELRELRTKPAEAKKG
jgi:predicted  nucleic acid-binding Zn-ribbon protein